MELKQKQFLAEKRTEAIKDDPEIAVLENLILSHGGEAVVWNIEEDLNCLIKRGKVFSTDRLRSKRGQNSQCHSNSGWQWHTHKTYRIVTGYGLGPDDDLWRQHTWILDSQKQIIETTVARRAYFGFILTKSESKQFFDDNL